MSKAIGPSRQMKRPSHNPITKQMTTSATKLSAKGMHIVVTPSNRKAPCCIWTRLRHLQSDASPKNMRETPDVMLMHIGSRFPSDPGKMSLVCLTCKYTVVAVSDLFRVGRLASETHCYFKVTCLRLMDNTSKMHTCTGRANCCK